MSVSEACDGRDALTQCEAAIPDVVLLDWNMPVMSGMEFLEALSQREMDARPKIIFCTTENGLGHIKAAVEAGADEYVMKPFDRDTLESKLQIVGVICMDLRMAPADIHMPIYEFPRGRRIRLLIVDAA